MTRLPYWSSELIARTSRDPLATRAPAERDLVNARPRLSKSSYQFKSICLLLRGAPRFLAPEVMVVGARALQRMPRSQQNGPPAAKPARVLRPRHARSRSESYGGARAASSGPGHAAGRAAGDGEAIKFTAVHEACAARPRRPASTLRAAAVAVHALMLRAVRGVQCRGGVPLQQAAQLAHPNRAGASVLLSHDKRALCRC